MLNFGLLTPSIQCQEGHPLVPFDFYDVDYNDFQVENLKRASIKEIVGIGYVQTRRDSKITTDSVYYYKLKLDVNFLPEVEEKKYIGHSLISSKFSHLKDSVTEVRTKTTITGQPISSIDYNYFRHGILDSTITYYQINSDDRIFKRKKRVYQYINGKQDEITEIWYNSANSLVFDSVIIQYTYDASARVTKITPKVSPSFFKNIDPTLNSNENLDPVDMRVARRYHYGVSTDSTCIRDKFLMCIYLEDTKKTDLEWGTVYESYMDSVRKNTDFSIRTKAHDVDTKLGDIRTIMYLEDSKLPKKIIITSSSEDKIIYFDYRM